MSFNDGAGSHQAAISHLVLNWRETDEGMNQLDEFFKCIDVLDEGS